MMMEQWDSNHLIFSNDFQSSEEAIAKVHSFRLGKVKQTDHGNFSDSSSYEDNLYFASETLDAFYSYTIEKYPEHSTLNVYETHKNKMVIAAERGDLRMYLKHFQNEEKMIEFTLRISVENGHWNILEYLVNNYPLKNNPIWYAIRYNKPTLIERLLDKRVEMPLDWLAYCLYSDSLEATTELLVHKKKHLEYNQSELKTYWFNREMLKETETTKLVKQVIN